MAYDYVHHWREQQFAEQADYIQAAFSTRFLYLMGINVCMGPPIGFLAYEGNLWWLLLIPVMTAIVALEMHWWRDYFQWWKANDAYCHKLATRIIPGYFFVGLLAIPLFWFPEPKFAEGWTVLAMGSVLITSLITGRIFKRALARIVREHDADGTLASNEAATPLSS